MNRRNFLGFAGGLLGFPYLSRVSGRSGRFVACCGFATVHIETIRGRHIATFGADRFYTITQMAEYGDTGSDYNKVEMRISFGRGDTQGLQCAVMRTGPDCVGLYLVRGVRGGGEVVWGDLLAVFRVVDLERIHSGFGGLDMDRWYPVKLEAVE